MARRKKAAAAERRWHGDLTPPSEAEVNARVHVCLLGFRKGFVAGLTHAEFPEKALVERIDEMDCLVFEAIFNQVAERTPRGKRDWGRLTEALMEAVKTSGASAAHEV